MRKQIQKEQQLGKYYTIVIEVNYYFKFINTAHNGSMLTHYHYFFIFLDLNHLLSKRYH